ncbi:Mechanosensitive channel MscK precursor [Roseimaritima multifibrata]|uniref:Mechanosensitive channel MscK n=2 Tax=Roseimaritima multifibrata TaxID=1930274 RepID=A0A517MDY8_9BACT|nr:Mechanosensitive channel MscK precursor [Roseimaritima multifibrata]
MALGILLTCLLVNVAGAQQQPSLNGPIDPAQPAPLKPVQTQATALPTQEELQKTTEEIKANTAIEDELRGKILERYKNASTALTQIAELQAAASQLEASAASAKKELANTKEALANPIEIEVSATRNSSMEEIEDEKDRLSDSLTELQNLLDLISTEIRTRKEDALRIPAQVTELQNKIQTLNAAPPLAEDVSPFVKEAARIEKAVSIAAAQQEIAVARQKLATYQAQSELLPAQQELYRKKIAATQDQLGKLVQSAAAQQADLITAQINKYNRLSNSTSEQYREDAAGSIELLAEWRSLVSEAATKKSESIALTSKLSALKQDYEKIEGLVQTDLDTSRGLSRSVGYLLQRKQAKLPSNATLLIAASDNTQAVEAAQSTLTQIEARLEDIDSRPETIPNSPEAIASAMERDMLRQMLRDAEELVIETLVPMDVTQESYASQVRTYRQLISKHLLWVRSAAPYSLKDLDSLDDATKWLIGRKHLALLGQASWRLPMEYPVESISWAVLLAGLTYLRGHAKRRLAALGAAASHRMASAMKPTFTSVLWTLILAIPVSVALIGPGWLLSAKLNSIVYLQHIGHALIVTGFVILPLEFLRQVVRQGGLATDHFAWPPSVITPIRRALWWMINVVTPLIFLWRVLEGGDEVDADLLSLSRLFFATAMLVVATVFWAISHPKRGVASHYFAGNSHGWVSQLWWLWRPLLVLIPIGLAVLCMIGYSYSATQLSFRFYRTIWIATTVTIVSGLSVRWLLISRRRIAIQQMKARALERVAAAERMASEPGTVELPETEAVDVADISAQTQRLLHAGLFVLVLFGLYRVWAPVLPALGFLDAVTLWTIKANDGTILETITMTNLLFAVPMLILTLVVVRNAPGLLETIILQRLPLENAVRYAITTLSSYLLATIGLLVTAKILGLHWSSVQWLVAGLGVGLGFGLQEIFANFISGIILLFEQPIRVGDVITLDGETGSVSKIRMRATTITNWDRQEVIVPNKNLITGTLVNWSLSDTVSRVQVDVGVAYGSDTTKVCKILAEIVERHPTAQPGLRNVITFEQFGDSTLNFTIRCFVPSLEVRLQTIHELHMEIDRRFREANIEIAFPQRDLNIRSIPDNWHQPAAAAPQENLAETASKLDDVGKET